MTTLPQHLFKITTAEVDVRVIVDGVPTIETLPVGTICVDSGEEVDGVTHMLTVLAGPYFDCEAWHVHPDAYTDVDPADLIIEYHNPKDETPT